ncbi:MAG: cytochrome c [Ignavibacteria bacterium]|nr:cytochrome c [Ignavibacteria bacterium]
MKKILKRILIGVGILLIIGFLAFLYFIPPFTLAPPETFIKAEADAAPSLDQIKDPAQRAIAERGKYLVMRIGCSGCHTPGGDQGPKFDTEYLAGGMKFTDPLYGTSISRNLTPDLNTGLGQRSSDQVKRTLRTGVFSETGRVFNPLFMPWGDFSNLTEEDRHAIMVFLRNLKPVVHKIPDFSPTSDQKYNSFYVLDYGIHGGK